MIGSPEVLNTADLETRIVAADSYAIGKAPGPRALVHTQLRVLFGQSPEAKRDLSDRIAGVLRGLAPRPNGVLVQLAERGGDEYGLGVLNEGAAWRGCWFVTSHLQRVFQLTQCLG